ncbi:uncharacterized protein LOC100373107 [Saccoglossus kowalevskii]|uniref:Uncharacterized protein LOC100373107 n=1 Tax=Saccoglossus kowalevskii TaxID=10224 RepID=A0ABM0GLX4_SACKO|nr:PREDICTED: uncharacterized protein LOC100373107 [Saccoglossus kowalevskii]
MTNNHYKRVLLVGVCALSLLSLSSGALTDWQDELDQFVLDVMQCRNVPGLSLSVVQDDQILLTKGYGDQERNPTVEAHADTVFPIGSLTKSFTSALIADILSEQSNVTWDTPIRSILGESFSLYGCDRTEEVSLRDLLSHQTGLLDDETLTIMGLDIEKSDFIKRIRFLKEKYGFRSRFLYSNLMYTLAGLVAESLTKYSEQSWQELVDKRLLRPLGMTSTKMISTIENLRTVPELAAGYRATSTGEVFPISLDTLTITDIVAPAGSILSTANDMAQWLLFQLSGRSRSNQQLVDEDYLRETQTAQVSMQEQGVHRNIYPVDDSKTDYAMGWTVGTYRGVKRLSHPGNIACYNSDMWIFPTENYGIFIAMNGPMNDVEATRAISSIGWFISDKMTGTEPWQDSESACNFWSTLATPQPDLPVAVPSPIAWSEIELNEYTGTYGNNMYGYLEIDKAEDEDGIEHLRYSYGTFGTGRLYRTATLHTFKATLNGDLWYYSDSMHFNKQEPEGVYMKFTNSNQNKMGTLTFPLLVSKGNTIQGPEFKRGLTVANPRTSPYDNLQCSKTTSGTESIYKPAEQLIFAIMLFVLSYVSV